MSLPPQPAAFCSFLVLNRQRRITREEVQTAFWPDAAPARAQERLRRTLYLLRRSIEPHTTLIATEGAEVAIAPETALWVDYEAFESALLDAFRDEQPRRAPLQRAVELYKDDLLKDIYADWVLLEREHARQQFLTALRHLLMVCQQECDWASVTRYAHNLLEYDPFQEVAHRALMRAFAASGDRSAALRQYQQCAAIMLEELDAEPLEETMRLYEDIRQGRGVVPEIPVVIAAPPPAPTVTDLQSVPLVGRDAELNAVAAEWRICQRGQSRLVLVVGPAGMGKTRLVNEAAQRIPGADVVTITGHCYAMEAGTPYQLIADLMRRSVDRVVDQLNLSVRDDLALIVPSLQPARAQNAAPQAGSAPDASLRVQEAVTQVIRALART
ncbi:MAG: AAA family ATPase, partial [Anaerolineae bacterium]|nr:AAA family ATPase [Anaerolineae bacterium]